MRRSLTKGERVRKKREFSRLFASPLRYQTQGMKLFFLYQDAARLGVTLARKFGTAVQRNKVKRQIREIFRNWKASASVKGDFLFFVYPGSFGFEERREQFLQLVERIPERAQP